MNGGLAIGAHGNGANELRTVGKAAYLLRLRKSAPNENTDTLHALWTVSFALMALHSHTTEQFPGRVSWLPSERNHCEASPVCSAL